MDWLKKVSSSFKGINVIASFLMLAVLSACGGSDSGFVDNGSGTGGGGTTNITTVTLSISNASVDAANPANVTATVADNNGPISGVVVTFTTTLGVLDPTSGTALTDANGQAVIEIHPGDVEGAGEITGSISSGEAGRVGFSSAGDGTAIAGKVLTISSSTVTISSATPATLTVTVTDGGVAVAGEVITFSTSLGVLDPASGTALTNASGQAQISLAAGTEEGAGLVTATASSGESTFIGFETAGDGSIAGGRALVVSIDNNSVDAANPRTVTAIVTDDGTPVANEVVTFTSTLGVLDPISGTALTDAAGTATITLAAGTVEGAGVVQATLATGEVNNVGFTTAGDGTSLGGRSLVITIDNPFVDSANPRNVTATLLDAGTPVANEVVTFTTTLGVLDPLSGTALTDAAGQAVIVLAAGTVEGAGVVTATVATGEADTLGFNTAGDGTDLGGRSLVVTVDNPSVDAANPRTLTATLLDAGTPVANEVVTFTTSLGVLDPLSGTALTDAAGQATITLAAGTVEGAGVATATVATGEADTLGFSSAGDGTNIGGRSLVVTIDNPSVDDANPRTVTATLLDAGTPVANEVVTFTTSLGILDPTSGTALTDAAGQATITLEAGTVEGAGVVTATVATGEADTLGFNTAGDGPVSGSLSLAIAIDNPAVDDANPRTLTATLLDGGVPVANEVVTFTATLGALDPASGTALTDAAGQATITLTAGSIAGAGVATATISTGEADSLGYSSAGDSTPVGTRSLNITIDNPAVDAANPRTLTATLLESGSPVANEVITFTSTLGTLNPASGTALTDAAGQATMTLLAGNVEGAGVATATVATGETDNLGFSTAGDGAGTGITVTLELTDTNGAILDPRQISTTTPGRVEATVTGITQPVIVTFSTDLGSIPVPTAITDAGNVATVDIFAANSLGAGTITGSLVTGETGNLVFSIGTSSLGIGTSVLVAGVPDDAIEVPGAAISAGGTASLSVTIWDTSTNPATVFTDAVDVSFSSACSNLASPTAQIDSPVTTINGIANSTYLAQGCEGDDIVTATANAGGVVLSATGTVTINTAAASNIEFVSATPENISLKGVGGTESSTVVFRVLDSNGIPVSNQDIDFSLSTDVGGIALSPVSATTNLQGEVQTVVNSGTVHTSVRVKASINGSSPEIFTQSNLLVISTGIPDQDSFSLSASVFNPEGWNLDGEEVSITARLADAFNNPAPDGTAVTFTTEGGSIEPSCVTTAGVCSVTWTSQNPRPEGQVLGLVNDGPTVITGTIDIGNGIDFTTNTISFSVAAGGASDTILLNSNFTSKATLLVAIEAQIINSTVLVGSGKDDFLELISTDNEDITIANIATGSGVTADEIVGIADGTTYYNDLLTFSGTVDINGGIDFTTNDIAFDITTTDGTDSVTINSNHASGTAIVNDINGQLLNSSVVVLEDASSGVLVVTSPTRLTVNFVDNGGTATALSQLGIADGNRFPSRVNSASPQTVKFMGQKYGGRATITATAIGEESFPDLNGNGVFDASEQNAFLGNAGESGTDVNGVPYDLKEMFVDHNEDGIYNPQSVVGNANGETGGEIETFEDFDVDGVFDVEDGLYNGSLCGDTPANCSATQSINVRGELVLVMSGSNPRFVTNVPTSGTLSITGDGTAAASVTIADLHNQPMPAGSTIEFVASVGSIVGPDSFTWPSTNRNGGLSFGVTVKGVASQTLSGPLLVTVTTPSGVVTSYTVATISITP